MNTIQQKIYKTVLVLFVLILAAAFGWFVAFNRYDLITWIIAVASLECLAAAIYLSIRTGVK